MQIFGLMLVRDEADILRVNILHHLAAGITKLLIVDNGSSDGTAGVIEDLSRDGRVEWTRDPGPYRQSEITTRLAREAWRKGAQWVVAIDADEFWCSTGKRLPDILAETRAGALEVQVVNFIQKRAQTEASAQALLDMTRRAPLPIGPLEHVRTLVESGEFAFVEMMYSTKWICRASESIEIAMGNHRVSGVPGPFEAAYDIVCLHAPLRSRATLDAKVLQGSRVEELGIDPVQGWHVRRWRRIALEGHLEREWSANSYDAGGLDVYGETHPVVFDPRLRDALLPWLAGPDEKIGDPAMDRAALLQTIHTQTVAHEREYGRLAKFARRDVEERDSVIRRLQVELQEKVSQRDRLIVGLQADLLSKVADRDSTIDQLTAELREKVGARDRVIHGLQTELLSKVGERDRTILKLLAELQEKVAARDQRIAELQEEVLRGAEQRDRRIVALTAELLEKVGARDAVIVSLQDELLSKVADRDRVILQLQAELHEKVSERDRMIAALQTDLQRTADAQAPPAQPASPRAEFP